MALFHSSVIVTGAATDTRTRDQLSFPFLARPQALTIYLRFVAMGTFTGYTNTTSGGASRRILQIGSDTGTRLLVYEPNATSQHRVNYTNNFGTGSSDSLTYAHNLGDTIELCATFSATGKVQLFRSINGGALTTGTLSGSAIVDATWGASTLYVCRAATINTGTSFNAMRNIEIMAGVQTMQAMRVRAGTD